MATIRKLNKDEVEFVLTVEFDETPVVGNALASGDDTADKKAEDAIIQRMNDGDVWAWAVVKIEAKYGGFVGTDYLGCCTFEDEEDFKSCGYYDDMQIESLAHLNVLLAATFKTIEPLIEA